MIILDADFLIDYFNRQPTAVKKFLEIQNQEIAVSVVTLLELEYGAQKQNKFFETEEFADTYHLLPFSAPEAKEAARIRIELEKKGGRIGVEDEMIAATVLIQNAALLTRNSKHFKRVKGLKIEKWKKWNSNTAFLLSTKSKAFWDQQTPGFAWSAKNLGKTNQTTKKNRKK